MLGFCFCDSSFIVIYDITDVKTGVTFYINSYLLISIEILIIQCDYLDCGSNDL